MEKLSYNKESEHSISFDSQKSSFQDHISDSSDKFEVVLLPHYYYSTFQFQGPSEVYSFLPKIKELIYNLKIVPVYYKKLFWAPILSSHFNSIIFIKLLFQLQQCR